MSRFSQTFPVFQLKAGWVSTQIFWLFWIFAGALPCTGAPASKAARDIQWPFRLEVRDKNGEVIADSGKGSRSSAVLTFEHEYQPGDRIVVSGPSRMAFRVDDWIPECLVYVGNSPERQFTYSLPFGQGEPATRSPFSQDSFRGGWHRITARELTAAEFDRYRNLAMNACDQEEQLPALGDAISEQQVLLFPHASTNSVSRRLPDFAARNAIDGMTENGHHGVWPYQSWGPELRNDLWWRVDFGRAVEMDKIRLMVRADFPHDGYWQSAVIEFSDGEQFPIKILQTAEFQDFSFSKRRVSWFRINKLAPAIPERWCSFIEVEAWGHDLR
jgi:hypothetical protein